MDLVRRRRESVKKGGEKWLRTNMTASKAGRLRSLGTGGRTTF